VAIGKVEYIVEAVFSYHHSAVLRITPLRKRSAVGSATILGFIIPP